MPKLKRRERRSFDSRRMFPAHRRSCSKGEVIDRSCLELLEGQINVREDGAKATFDAATAFELGSRGEELKNHRTLREAGGK